MRFERVLITGGAGFLGTHLCERLVGDVRVRIFDSFHRNALRFTDIATHPAVEIVQGDVLDYERVLNVVDGCDLVIHAAAIAGVSHYLTQPLTTMETNLIGSYNVLRAAAQRKVKRFLMLSSCEVYGQHARWTAEEEATAIGTPLESRWCYGASKVGSEHLAMAFQRQKNLPVTILRPFNIYGPRQIGEGAIANFCRRAVRGEPIEIYGTGSQRRAWCHVEDFTRAVLLCLERESGGEVFNIGNPDGDAAVSELARLIVEISGSRSELRFLPQSWAETQERRPNIARARRVLGFEPRVSLRDGIARTVEWFRTHREALQ